MSKVRRHRDGWVEFDCPGCSATHYPNSPITLAGIHLVNIDPAHKPCWGYNGDDERPTLTPSVLVRLPLPDGSVHTCHFFVRNGQIHYCADSTHSMAGKIVDMVELTEEGEA